MRFKERNLLKKLDLGLNIIQISKQEIVTSNSEALQKEALPAESRKPLFVLDIPPVAEEFPDQSHETSKMFPLPLSHENQCTNVGAASNLELFAEEFKFSGKKEKKSVPLTFTLTEFDLDAAYSRYAFLKELERHKEEQKRYEQILRGEDVEEGTNERLFENVVESDTSSTSDIDEQ